MRSFLKRYRRALLHPISFVVIGICIGVIVYVVGIHILGGSCFTRSFPHINPMFGCKTPVVNQRGYVELKSALQTFIADEVKTGKISSLSVYFRDLQNGPTLGIDEHEKFAPASLLKLPLLLTYLELAENHPSLLATRLEYDHYDEPLTQSIAPEKSILPGTPYSIDEMLSYMIRYSDNRAYYVLREYLRQISPDEDLLKNTYIALGIVDPKNDLDQTIEVKQYSSIFIQLYNASFFDNKETSERALALLMETTFDKGLVAGVPAGLPVAHKFGERVGFAGNLQQLHDCGIVYFPKSPYLLCVMTRGTDRNELSHAIKQISTMVYTEVGSRRLR